jgi:hypothetical protein
MNEILGLSYISIIYILEIIIMIIMLKEALKENKKNE